MPILMIITLFLTGCTSEAQAVEAQLNDYARAAARGSDLSELLSGKALASAQQSARLIRDFELSVYGASRFSNTQKLRPGVFESCLDVSGTEFRDSLGLQVGIQRLNRQLVEIRLEGAKITDLNFGGVKC